MLALVAGSRCVSGTGIRHEVRDIHNHTEALTEILFMMKVSNKTKTSSIRPVNQRKDDGEKLADAADRLIDLGVQRNLVVEKSV